MKKCLFVLILCFFFLISAVDANEASSAPGGNSNEVPSGSEYNVSRLGIKVTLINSDGIQIPNSDSVIFWPYSKSGDSWIFNDDISGLDYTPAANHVKFNKDTSYGGVTMGCFKNNGVITSNNCNLYVYLKKIVSAKDDDLINFFVRKTLNLPLGAPINDYTNYYLKFEPYYKVNYNYGGTAYVKFGTSYEIMYHIFGNNYPPAPLASVSNFVKSISSDTNFNGLTTLPTYYKGNDENCNGGDNGDACKVSTEASKIIYDGKTYSEIYKGWLSPNWLNALAISTLDKYKLTYYYVNYSKSSSQQSGLGVGYIRIKDIVTVGDECVDVFRSNMTMSERIALYKSELTKKNNFTNLLNKDITKPTEACKAATCVYNNSTGCLSASINNGVDFNANNLSCYNETEDITGLGTAYCLTKFNLNSSFGSLGSASQPFIVTSGRLIFNSKVGTTGVLNRVCYLYGGSGTIKPLALDDYINSFEYLPGETSVTSDPRITSNKDVYLGDGYTKYEDTVEIDFISPSIYADNISGVITYNNSSCSTCKFLGYGLISKLNENGKTTFETKLKLINGSALSKYLGKDNVDLTCHYKANLELIKEKLLLKFRIIDTSNPFPGPDALGREVGSNWCDAFDCTNENAVVKETIIEANNSYNKTGAGPKYSIILTSNDIQVIRKYNKETTYDDYNFTCSGSGYDCESKFLKGLVNGSLSYNGNFIGNVSNKLIIR